MNREDLDRRIADLEREIAILPQGSITKKSIKGKEYYYHRISIEGKRKEKYIRPEKYEELSSGIEKRKALEKELRDAGQSKRLRTYAKKIKEIREYKTIVRIGSALESQILSVKGFRKRACFSKLYDYIFGDVDDKVFILYGLRRTGKTTLIRQVLGALSKVEFEKAAFIQITAKDTLSDVNADLRILEKKGYKYIFIDEVTLMEDFIEGAALFADIYASSGMKIVLSGTDSLGFAFSREDQLYDRCLMLHTTYIPYREFDEVLGIKGIDEYIRYGGTMSLGGVNYNSNTPFSSAQNAQQYIDTAIAKNIQHSLKLYQYGGHFRGLIELYEHGELTNVINRVVEDINHRFTREVVERAFKSGDISITATNLLRDREQPIDIKAHMDLDSITRGIMTMLDILDKEGQSVGIEDDHMIQIKEYLTLLDLICEIDVEYLPEVRRKGRTTVITQPGMRYAQAKAIIDNLILDEKFQELSALERKRITGRLLSEICGRMMEDIVLLETKINNPDKSVFKLQFAIGEYDMVIFDPEALNCRIFEIKHSTEQVPEQYRFLKDEERCSMTSHRYGDIIEKCVIYRGKDDLVEGIHFLNVERYLTAGC